MPALTGVQYTPGRQPQFNEASRREFSRSNPNKRNIPMKPFSKSILAALVATALIPAAAMADTPFRGYVLDSSGVVVTSGITNLCWHDTDWTQARSQEPCDPNAKPVAIAPAAAAPIVVAAAPVSRTQKVSFSGDALFAFDKSVLKPEGKAMLDDMAGKLDSTTTYDTIMVTGHTDRFGSSKYNQKLSERRAASVKDYLAGKNIQSGRISAQGKGELQPVTKADQCRGAKTAKVVACLQPDRRVDIEITGTKTVVSAL
jgi:OOP family OmpA-OmpF porin